MDEEDLQNINQQILFRTIGKWHPTQLKRYTQIQLIQLELKTLKNALTNKTKRGQQQALSRKIGFIEDQSANVIQQAEAFLLELEKSLKATERQCNKRMQKIEKDSLHRDIQIRSMLDQQILLLVQQNKILEISQKQIQPYIQAYTITEQKLKQERKSENQMLLSCHLELEQFKFATNKKMKEIKKAHKAKMQQLQNKMKNIEQAYTFKLSQLKRNRQKFQKVILEHIEKKITLLTSSI